VLRYALIGLLALPGCAIHTGVGITPDRPEHWERDDPHFVLLAETRTQPVRAFYLHSSSITEKDPSWGYNLIGVGTTFEIGE